MSDRCDACYIEIDESNSTRCYLCARVVCDDDCLAGKSEGFHEWDRWVCKRCAKKHKAKVQVTQ